MENTIKKLNDFLSNKDNYKPHYFVRCNKVYQIDDTELNENNISTILINCYCTIDILELILDVTSNKEFFFGLMLQEQINVLKQNESFVEKYINKLDIGKFTITKYLGYCMSESFITRNIDKFIISYLGSDSRQQLSESFLDRFADKLDWSDNIFRTQNLTEQQVKKYIKYAECKTDILHKNIQLSEQYLLELFPIDINNGYVWTLIVKTQTLSEQLIRKLYTDLFLPLKESTNFNGKRFFNDFWVNLQYNENIRLNESFWSEFIQYIDWYKFAIYQTHLSEKWINDNWQHYKFYIGSVIRHKELSIEFIEQHAKDFELYDWSDICYHQKLPISFIENEKYKQYMDYNKLYYSKHATKEIKEQYFEKRNETNGVSLKYVEL